MEFLCNICDSTKNKFFRINVKENKYDVILHKQEVVNFLKYSQNQYL